MQFSMKLVRFLRACRARQALSATYGRVAPRPPQPGARARAAPHGPPLRVLRTGGRRAWQDILAPHLLCAAKEHPLAPESSDREACAHLSQQHARALRASQMPPAELEGPANGPSSIELARARSSQRLSLSRARAVDRSSRTRPRPPGGSRTTARTAPVRAQGCRQRSVRCSGAGSTRV